jgi:hypothetical protein
MGEFVLYIVCMVEFVLCIAERVLRYIEKTSGKTFLVDYEMTLVFLECFLILFFCTSGVLGRL